MPEKHLIKTFAILFLFAVVPAAGAGEAPPRKDLNEEIISIPARIHDQDLRLEATLYRPNRTGRFPLIVLNHGTNTPSPGYHQPRERFLNAAGVFVSQGYAVVALMRRGYGGSEGERIRTTGNDLVRYGLENALDVRAGIQYLKRQSYVDPGKIVVMGQSTGGLATVAYLQDPDPGVLGGVNFHGGVRPGNLIKDPLLDAAVVAFSEFARTTRLPSLWIYTENDHASRPEFIRLLHQAYNHAGGKAQLIQLGVFKKDGHMLVHDSDGKAIWVPLVRKFLASLHLP